LFTGLVEELGSVIYLRKSRGGAELKIKAQTVLNGTKIGDSISVSGVCLTVTEIGRGELSFFTSLETLNRTNLKFLKPRDFVNLERALTPNSRLGGHIVQGHVDAVLKVIGIRREGEGFRFEFSIPQSYEHLLVEKGSVAIDGISLTVAEISRGKFSVAVIPHTYERTTLKFRRAGDLVNVEFDVIGKYVERMLRVPHRGT